MEAAAGKETSKRPAAEATAEAESSKRPKTVAAAPFTEDELDSALTSLKRVASDDGSSIDWSAVRSLLASAAHQPHSDWARIEEYADVLGGLIGGADTAAFRAIFYRVLRDGGWDSAAAAAATRPKTIAPWAVLIMGTNGIRKTTSVYEPWFGEALRCSLRSSSSCEELPFGGNSFFRQLDFIMATVANEEFRFIAEIPTKPPLPPSAALLIELSGVRTGSCTKQSAMPGTLPRASATIPRARQRSSRATGPLRR